MPVLSADQHNTQGNLRSFVQFGGPGPEQPTLYGGADMGWVQITGVDLPLVGDVKAMFVHNPNAYNSYIPVARMLSAPDLASSTVEFSEKMGGIPRYLQNVGCQFNVYESVGACGDPGNFLKGWSQYITIYPRGTVKKVSLGDRTSFEKFETLKGSLDVTWQRIMYAVSKLGFGQAALGAALTATLPIDACYGSGVQCGGDCGADNDGTRYQYVLLTGITAVKPQVSYSTDGGVTWTTAAISAAANAEVPTAIATVANYLVVLSKTGGGANQSALYLTDINPYTGVPNSANWIKITNGFLNVASRGANDILVISNSEILFPADSGYMYKSTDITAGVTQVIQSGSVVSANLSRMDNINETIVAVGATNAVIKSNNDGRSFAATTTSPTAGNITALAMVDRSTWWVGGDNGTLWYTRNAGETWVQKRFSGDGSGTITDIVFATPEIGYFVHNSTTPQGRVFSTWNGGYSWDNTAPRIFGLPTFNSTARIAIPQRTLDTVASNNVLLVGAASGGANGTVLTASAAIV